MKKSVVVGKVNRKVEKLNEFVRESIKACGGEQEIYLDNISTIEGLPKYIEPNYNVKDDGYLYAGDIQLCRAYYKWEDGSDDDWTEDDELSDTIRWEKACIRRGVRYYKEYSLDFDENEAAKEKFMNSL